MENLFEILIDNIVPIAILLVTIGTSISKSKNKDNVEVKNIPNKNIVKNKIQENKLNPRDIFDKINKPVDKINKSTGRNIQPKKDSVDTKDYVEQILKREEKLSLKKDDKEIFPMEEKREEVELNLHAFSEDPLTNGIIFSEILGKPKSLRND